MRHPVHEDFDTSRTPSQRIALWVTDFVGSMPFVYIHVFWFSAWIFFGVEAFPFGLLTMLVSLEAIFLSTFVMIGQNALGDFQQLKADHDFNLQVQELRANTDLTKEVHQLTVEIHKVLHAG